MHRNKFIFTKKNALVFTNQSIRIVENFVIYITFGFGLKLCTKLKSQIFYIQYKKYLFSIATLQDLRFLQQCWCHWRLLVYGNWYGHWYFETACCLHGLITLTEDLNTVNVINICSYMNSLWQDCVGKSRHEVKSSR